MTDSKYGPWTAYLQGQPADAASITASLSELECLLSGEMPPTARRARPWWANTASHSQGAAWLAAGWRVRVADLEREEIVFERLADPVGTAKTAAGPTRSAGAYQGLHRFLDGVPRQQEQLALTFREWSAAVGQDLPESARSMKQWWANTESHVQGAAWLAAGWRVTDVYLKAQVVVLRRLGEDPATAISRCVGDLLEGSRRCARPDAPTLTRWLRFCRLAGWYFEGTVLYERPGTALDPLNEIQRAELEEDYTVCRRELGRFRLHETDGEGKR